MSYVKLVENLKKAAKYLICVRRCIEKQKKPEVKEATCKEIKDLY